MKKNFFSPYVGCNYSQGIKGKNVLVVGASFYCNKTECQFFKKCTDRRKKDSSEYDLKCPEYVGKDMTLHDEPTNCVYDQPYAYGIFGAFLADFLGITQEDLWGRLAFTNYVQFFLPAHNGEYAPTQVSDVSQRDFNAFIDVVRELKPDVVIVWGAIINSFVMEKNPYIVNITELKETENYLCHLKVPGVDHLIAVVNPYHPSSSAWYSNSLKFVKYLDTVLNEQI